MLRALFVLAVLAIGFRYSLKGPFYALLLYLWLGYFRPESWLWSDFISGLNLSLIVGAAIFGLMIFARDRFVFGLGPAVLWGTLLLSLLSVVVSPFAAEARPYWIEFAKIIAICYMMIVLVSTEERLRLVLLTIGFSLAFEAAKQGWAELILHPGMRNMNTHPVLGDNNGVAVGILMLTAILGALSATASTRVERYLERFLAFGTLYRALSTYSRGGFLSCAVLGLVFLVRSKHRIRAIAAVVLVTGVIASVLPQEFWDRMGTIQDAAEGRETDDSIASRLHFWRVATVMAAANPITGVGHNAFNFIYDQYDDSEGRYGYGRSVHSSWFGVLAEWGVIGFLVFVMLVAGCFVVTRRVRRLAKTYPDLARLAIYATGLEAGLLVFVIGGSFVPFQYNEMLWHFIALTMVVGRLASQRLAAGAPAGPADANQPVLVQGIAS